MSEKQSSIREVFFGLEEYFNFLGDKEKCIISRELGKVYAEESIGPSLFNAYTKILYLLSEDKTPNNIFRAANDYIKKGHDVSVLQDVFSRSQMQSKIWLVEELAKINLKFDNILILAGWFGQLKFMLDHQIIWNKMRIVDQDLTACEISDYVFNLYELENHKVKSVCSNIDQLTIHKNGYELEIKNFKYERSYVEKFLPNLIINTSAEHMTEEWFYRLKFKNMISDPVVVIQSNNLFDLSDHINCVHSIDHMKKKFSMSEIFFEGELHLKGYKRVMLIGRP